MSALLIVHELLLVFDKQDEYEQDIFRHNGVNCFGKTDRVNINECDYVQRLISGLRVYSSYNKYNSSQHARFIEFCDEIYQNLLNDYIHLITMHKEQIKDISAALIDYNDFRGCNVKKCMLTQRHYRRTDNNMINENVDTSDQKLMFFCKLFDSIHMYLLHLFDLGLRLEEHDEVDPSLDEIHIDEKTCIDKVFSHKYELIANKRKELGSLMSRFNDSNNKYTIAVGYQQKNQIIHGQATTFVDEILKLIKNDEYQTSQLMSFWQEEEYDSDAIKADVKNLYQCNIQKMSLTLTHQTMQVMQNYSQDIELSSCSFSTGFILYYWDYYKTITTLPQKEEYNINEFGGYDICDLYVSKKQQSLKLELLNQNISMNQYNALYMKVQEYMKSDKVKEIKCEVFLDPLHFGIKPSTSISEFHIMAVIVYCDLTELSTTFSSTFRKATIYETLNSIKERNANFWWMSRYLREAVQYFGTNGDGKFDKERNEYIDQEQGPFYCGLNKVMNIPEFCIRLCGPTSTSKKFEVSMNFAQRDGIIMQLNNDGHLVARKLSFFDCCWLSQYKEEEERLFNGGNWRIRIQSIRIVATKQNFNKFFEALFFFDCMINGSELDMIKITDKDKDIVKRVLSGDKSVPEYVIDTFNLFCSNKRQVVINIRYLKQKFHKIYELIMEPIQNDYDFLLGRYPSRLRNLLKKVIFEVFRNMNELIIYTTDANGGCVYSFDVLQLLPIIKVSSSWKRIKIKAVCQYETLNWILSSWQLNSGTIKARFAIKGYKVYLSSKHTTNRFGFIEKSLIIERRVG